MGGSESAVEARDQRVGSENWRRHRGPFWGVGACQGPGFESWFRVHQAYPRQPGL